MNKNNSCTKSQPNVPEDRIAMLRTAIAKTVEDPEFLKDAENQSLSINFVAGEEIQTTVQEAYEYPDDGIALTKSAN